MSKEKITRLLCLKGLHNNYYLNPQGTSGLVFTQTATCVDCGSVFIPLGVIK